MGRIKKFAVIVSGVHGSCKRSLPLTSIEILFITCQAMHISKHRKDFDITFSFSTGELNKAVKVKKLPLSYLAKFSLQS